MHGHVVRLILLLVLGVSSCVHPPPQSAPFRNGEGRMHCERIGDAPSR